MKTKIKLFVTLLGIVLIAAQSMDAFATYSRTTRNGGPNGYNDTKKTVDSDGNTTISCENPGYESCPTLPPPPPPSGGGDNGAYYREIQIQNGLVQYAIVQISIGHFNGLKTVGNFLLEWHSTDREMRNSEIRVERVH